jgi:hypothetical protein
MLDFFWKIISHYLINTGNLVVLGHYWFYNRVYSLIFIIRLIKQWLLWTVTNHNLRHSILCPFNGHIDNLIERLSRSFFWLIIHDDDSTLLGVAFVRIELRLLEVYVLFVSVVLLFLLSWLDLVAVQTCLRMWVCKLNWFSPKILLINLLFIAERVIFQQLLLIITHRCL